MNIKSWIKSEYVTYIGNALLSFFGLEGQPLRKMEGKPPLGSLVSHRESIAEYLLCSNIFFMKIPWINHLIMFDKYLIIL